MNTGFLRIGICIGLFCLYSLSVSAVSEFGRNWGVVEGDYYMGAEFDPYLEDVPLEQDEISLDADEITSEDEVFYRAKGNVIIRYREAAFYAEEITFDRNTQIVECPGWARLEYREKNGQKYTVIGEKGIFNLSNEAGQFENAHMIVDFGPFKFEGRWYERKWYVYGERVTKDADDRIFHVEDGRATTCPPEYKSPLYSIEAKRMTVFVPDNRNPDNLPRISARNLFLKFEGVPILWLPQLTYTIREEDNQSPVQVSSGYDGRKGGYIDASVDVFRNRYLTLTPHIGYYSEHGISLGLDGQYFYEATNITKLSGTWKTFFLEDMSRTFTQQRDRKGEEGDSMFRYRFLWQHTQTFGPGAGWLDKGVLTFQLDWMSDPDILYDFYYDDYVSHGPRDTYLDFTKPIGPDNEVSIYTVLQINKFFTTYERLPELRHVFRKRRILTIPTMNVPVFYESQTRGGYYHFIENEDIPDHTSYTLWRAWTDHKFSAPKRFFNFLNINPFVGIAGELGHVSQYTVGKNFDVGRRGRIKAWTERTPSGFWRLDYNRYTRSGLFVYMPQEEGTYFRAIPYAGLDASFKMHRTYNFEGTYMGELMRRYLSSDNEKLRHIIEPKAHLLTAYGAGTDSSGALGADVGIRNAFQIERKGENKDLVDFTMMFSQRFYGSGMFSAPTRHKQTRFNRDLRTAEVKKFKDYQPESLIGFDIRATPFEWATLEADLVWDLYKLSRLSRATMNMNFDVSWAVQRMFASPYMPRNLRGRKDEALVYFGYRYLYDISNQISVGGRVWFDDFTPLLSVRQQQKSWMRELARGWGAEFNIRYEAKSGTLQEMEYTLYKNWKKCLDTSVTYRYRDGDNAVFATFWLTAYPSSKIDLGN
jgi:hypothetical protein